MFSTGKIERNLIGLSVKRRYMTEAVLDLPEGWLSLAEAEVLREMARGKTVLEIGSWLGRSTAALASVARLVVAVDHHHGPPYDGEGSTLGRFLKNLEQREIKNVLPFLADSAVALPVLGPCFDLAFIDGAHDAVSAMIDGKAAWRVVVPGGWLAFHDYGNHAGVSGAVDELCRFWGVRHQARADSLALIQRTTPIDTGRGGV